MPWESEAPPSAVVHLWGPCSGWPGPALRRHSFLDLGEQRGRRLATPLGLIALGQVSEPEALSRLRHTAAHPVLFALWTPCHLITGYLVQGCRDGGVFPLGEGYRFTTSRSLWAGNSSCLFQKDTQ
jgi:hypothetical protein